MRVLHVIPSVSERSGGPSQAIFPMCQALQALGLEVTLATTKHGLSTSDLKLCEQGSLKGVKTQLFDVNWGDSFKYSKSLKTWMDRNVEHFDLVHIHALFNHSSIASARACKKHSVPYVIRPLGSLDPWGMKQKKVRKLLFWNLIGKGICVDSAGMHYTAPQEKDAVESFLNLNHGTVIPLGIGAAATDSAIDGDELSLPQPYVLVLARLLPTKNIDLVLEAFLSVLTSPSLNRWSLVIAGDGPKDYVSALKAKALQSTFLNRVVFTGWLDDVSKSIALSKSSLLVLASDHENFGLSVMEAMASGVAVLVSPQVAIADEIQKHKAGWVVKIEHDSVVRTLAAALQDADELKRRGEAGLQLSRQYSWANVGKQLQLLYESILNSSVRSRTR